MGLHPERQRSEVLEFRERLSGHSCLSQASGRKLRVDAANYVESRPRETHPEEAVLDRLQRHQAGSWKTGQADQRRLMSDEHCVPCQILSPVTSDYMSDGYSVL